MNELRSQIIFIFQYWKRWLFQLKNISNNFFDLFPKNINNRIDNLILNNIQLSKNKSRKPPINTHSQNPKHQLHKLKTINGRNLHNSHGSLAIRRTHTHTRQTLICKYDVVFFNVSGFHTMHLTLLFLPVSFFRCVLFYFIIFWRGFSKSGHVRVVSKHAPIFFSWKRAQASDTCMRVLYVWFGFEIRNLCWNQMFCISGSYWDFS